jgi:hypothetical protein
MDKLLDGPQNGRGEAEAAPVSNQIESTCKGQCASDRAARCGECAEIFVGLNNALASVILNAQVMEWKLPSYSRSKRYLHEIERNAQRGGELVKRLLGRLQAGAGTELSPPRTAAKNLSGTGTNDIATTGETAGGVPSAVLADSGVRGKPARF